MRYPKERKEAVLKKMMPPHSQSIPDLANEEGISEATLYNWRREARDRGSCFPAAILNPRDGTHGISSMQSSRAPV